MRIRTEQRGIARVESFPDSAYLRIQWARLATVLQLSRNGQRIEGLGGGSLVSPSLEPGEPCGLGPCQRAPVDDCHVVHTGMAWPNRAEPCPRSAGEPSGGETVDSKLIRPVDVQPRRWPEGDRLRHGIVDGSPDDDRSSKWSPPSSQPDDSIVAEALDGSGIEGAC